MASRKTPKKPRLYLRHGEKISKGLKTIAMLQCEAAIAELHSNNVSPGPVHNARLSIKKIRAIIQLAAPALGRSHRESLFELLHEAGSRLAPLRDSEVQVRSLDLAVETAQLPCEPFSSLRNGLADIAKQRRANDWRQIPRVVGFLEKIRKDIPDWPLDHLGAKDIRRRIRRTYRRGRTTLDACSVGGDLELFHAWRKLLKQLGYQLCITSRYWPDQAATLIDRIAKIENLAGRERDYSMLLQTMKNGPKNRPCEEATAIITNLLPPLRQQAIDEGVIFYEAKPKLFVEMLDL
ncbi:MAG: CHAD domain-containing protein [bacterium]